MNDFVLRAKYWQVFLCLLAPRFASWFVTDNDVDTALTFSSVLIMLLWLTLLVSALSRMQYDIRGCNYKFLLINVFLVSIAFGYSAVADDPDFQLSSSSFKASGIGSLIILYILFAYMHAHWFPASLLVAKETGNRPDVSQVVVPFLALFFWPIGIWFVQPRVNKLWNDKQWEKQAITRLGSQDTIDENDSSG
ncbi:hypothetical protein MTX78_02840 [Hymenobacter tibetensis]|uniref:DUF805 domain-containing protein n=1 Tax=Hymenobacter tibetensis TaxID=497967 RepID=A0ABY4D212_9BACT|nr:hypothetical protein [Hymenobacter tibetensis]UOG75540.1 hypothetical protein MTX78_02840 [Hymenobacter tibetensis]